MGYVLNRKANIDVTSASYFYNVLANNLGIMCAVSSMVNCTFNGTSLTKTGESSGYTYAASNIASDGTYFYVVFNGVLRAFSIINGVPTEVGSAYTLTGLTNIKGMMCDSRGYIYVASTQGITAFSFNGAIFTNRATVVCAQTINLCTDGTYIFAVTGITTDNYVRAFTFDGSSFTARGEYLYSNSSVDVNCCYHDGTYLIIGDDSANGVVSALSHDGTDFVLIGSINTGKSVTSIDGDGYFIYVVSLNGPLSVLLRTGDSFAIVSTIIDANINNSGAKFPRSISVRAPYVYYISSDNLCVARMDLTAQFMSDKLTGIAPLTVQFTAI
jgi:hypothetical protein